MQEQVVFRAGNSNVVAIPKSLSKNFGIKPGQKVVVEQNGPDELVIRKASRTKSISPDLELKSWWKEFLKDNGEILDELALR